MREILFRGKRIDNGEWFVGFYGKSGEKVYIIYDNDIAVSYVSMKEVAPETVGQYTGYEKNDNKIFEGDIVRTQRGKLYEIKLYKGAWVVWDRKAKHDIYKWDFLNTFLPTIEVIGNIHDNPELLKGGVQE